MAVCPACGEENAQKARFCWNCGAALAEAAAPQAEERKVVSVLFVDLVGFTARSETADPEDVRATLRPYHARVREEIERFGGTVEKFVGDAVMAVFGAPVTHEDDAERAVRAGLRILDVTEELGLEVRAAINTGEAVVSLDARPERGEGIVAGDVVNTASRLQAAAPVGTLVVGEPTYRTTRDRFEYEELEPVALKGKTEPVPLWRAKEARSRFGVDVEAPAPAPFLGRDDDLRLLEQTFSRMLREQSVQLVTVAGEPGVGKTRLVAEFSSYVDDRPELVFWRQGRCLPYGDGITFWAFGEMIKGHAGILESDSAETTAVKLREAVATAAVAEGERDWIVSRLGPLVGVGDGAESADRAEAFAAWRTFIEHLAAQRPLVLVFEDLHWADPALLEFVEHLADWATDSALLIVCTARPELYERSAGWGGGKRNSTTISLSPLEPSDTARLVSALLAQSVLPAETQTALLERSGGNPLYAEEFARMLADRGLGGAEDIAVPDTVQALIAARLDTLPADRKALLHDAAVIGKVFWAGAVASMGDRDAEEVREGLHELARKELVRRARMSSMADDVEYAFWHALVRDVAYGQIPRSARARKHVAAAQWLEGIAGARITDHAELLVHHYGTALELATAAGDTAFAASVTEAAAGAFVMAGDRTTALEPTKAEDYYRRAIELLAPDDPRRGRVLVEAADNAELSGRATFDEIRGMFDEAIRTFRERGDTLGAANALRRLAWFLWMNPGLEPREPVLEEARRLVDEHPPGPMRALVYAAIAHSHEMASRSSEALEWANRAIPLLEQFELHDELLRARTHRGLALAALGEVDAGLAELRTALAEALASGRVYATTAIGAAHNNLAVWEGLAGEGVGRTEELLEAVIEISRRRGATRPQMWQLANSIGAMFELGRWDEALAAAAEVMEWDNARGGSTITLMAAESAARIRVLRGEEAAASNLVSEAVPRALAAGDPQILMPILAAAVVVEQMLGRSDAAIARADDLENSTHELPDFMRTIFVPEVARACAAVGELAVVERLLDRRGVKGKRLEYADLSGRAVLAEAKGEAREAAELYVEAAERWRDYGHVVEEGYALLGLGRCQLALGDPAGAAAVADARAIFTRLGAAPLVREADALLAEATPSASAS